MWQIDFFIKIDVISQTLSLSVWKSVKQSRLLAMHRHKWTLHFEQKICVFLSHFSFLHLFNVVLLICGKWPSLSNLIEGIGLFSILDRPLGTISSDGNVRLRRFRPFDRSSCWATSATIESFCLLLVIFGSTVFALFELLWLLRFAEIIWRCCRKVCS